MFYAGSWFDEGDRSIPGPGAHNYEHFETKEKPKWTIGRDTIRDTFFDKHRLTNPPPNLYDNGKTDTTHVLHRRNSVHNQNTLSQNTTIKKTVSTKLTLEVSLIIGRSLWMLWQNHRIIHLDMRRRYSTKQRHRLLMSIAVPNPNRERYILIGPRCVM